MFSSLTRIQDGGYRSLNCISAGVSFVQPMACRISRDGKLLWSKIFSTPFTGSFRYGFETTDGYFVFSGQTSSFVSGTNQNDLIILKTDKNGNLK